MEDLVQTASESATGRGGHQNSVLDAMAKEVGRLLWHNDPARPFSDEAWAREIKWWNAAKSPNPIEDVREAWYADKCYRVARGLLSWMAECELPKTVIASGQWACVEDVIKVSHVFRNMVRSMASAQVVGEERQRRDAADQLAPQEHDTK